MIFAPKKSLGQNFLMHRQTAERIVEAAMLPPGSTVLEIGPGTGMLTRALLAKASTVIAVEADASLVSELAETFKPEVEKGSLVLVHADIRNFEITTLPSPYHLVANIPYYITGELLRTFLSSAHKPATMTFLVQKEVAERIARSTKESLLSIAVKAYGTPKYMFTVPRGAFVPAPSVDSAVLHIADISATHFAHSEEEERFFTILRTGFAHKRKQLAKNLEAVAPKDKVKLALEHSGVLSTVRAEDLSLALWLSLSKELRS